MQCSTLENGGELIYHPVTSTFQAFFHSFRAVVVNKFGPHLVRLGVINFVKPSPNAPHQYLTSKCFNTHGKETDAIMRVSGYSIKQKTNDPILTPDLIVSSFEIDWNQQKFQNKNTCAEVCATKKKNQQCVCIPCKQLLYGGRDVVYQIEDLNAIQSPEKYFTTVGSEIGFNRFNLFNDEVIPQSQSTIPIEYDVTLVPKPTEGAYVFGGQSSTHIFLNDYNLNREPSNDPMINIALSRATLQNIEPFDLKVSIESLENKNIYRNQERWTNCSMTLAHPECHLSVYSEYDHHISIENNGDSVQNLTLRFTKGKSVFSHYESNVMQVFDAHQHHKHHQSHALYAIFSIAGLLCFFLLCAITYFEKYYPQRKRNRRDQQQETNCNYQRYVDNVLNVDDQITTESVSENI